MSQIVGFEEYHNQLMTAALDGGAEEEELRRSGGRESVVASIRRHMPSFDPAEAQSPYDPAWVKLKPILVRAGLKPVDETVTLTDIKAFLDAAPVVSAHVTPTAEPDEDAASLPATEHVLPMSVVKGTRRYLEQIVIQANGCYEKGWYDACSVMVRKLVEVLIITVYEAKGEAESIKKDGNFLMLSGLIDDILTKTAWNLGRETKAALPLLKSLGDRSAHNRHYMARKQDVDKVLQGLRVAVEDLLHQANLVK